MTTTVLGMFGDKEDAKEAIVKLKRNGYNPKEMSILMKDTEEGKEVAKDTGTKVAEGTASGAATGAVLGGIAGAISSVVLPGLGAFFIGGPIAAAIGLTGAAAATVSGAATGAVAGGLLGMLLGFGLSEEDAKIYESRINEGGVLVAIPAHEGDEAMLVDFMEDNGADQVKTLSLLPRRDTTARTSSVMGDYAASKGGKVRRGR